MGGVKFQKWSFYKPQLVRHKSREHFLLLEFESKAKLKIVNLIYAPCALVGQNKLETGYNP